LQGVRGGVVGAEFRIEVAENSDANGITHGSIVLERVEGGVTFKRPWSLAALRDDNFKRDDKGRPRARA
jgi:hypothetical protein